MYLDNKKYLKIQTLQTIKKLKLFKNEKSVIKNKNFYTKGREQRKKNAEHEEDVAVSPLNFFSSTIFFVFQLFIFFCTQHLIELLILCRDLR